MHFTKGQESHPFCYTRGTWSRYFSKKGTVGGSEGGMRGQQKQPNQPRDQISVPSVTASKRTEPRPTCSSGFLRSGPQAGPSGTAASVPGQWSARGPSLPLKGKELCNGPSLFVSSWFCCCFVLFLKYSRAQRYVFLLGLSSLASPAPSVNSFILYSCWAGCCSHWKQFILRILGF